MLYILGNGGHAKVLESICFGHRIGAEGEFSIKDLDRLIIGVGDLKTRVILSNKYRSNQFHNVIQSNQNNIKFLANAQGLQILHGAIIQAGAVLEDHVLVNTGAQIDHDCHIHSHCIISPGAILCGGVTLGFGCQIGAGAIILEGVTLDAETKIPAGSLVVKQDDIRKPVPMVHNDRTRVFVGQEAVPREIQFIKPS